MGDCRGAVVSTTQNPDGYCINRQAILSMHETPHDIAHELLYSKKWKKQIEDDGYMIGTYKEAFCINDNAQHDTLLIKWWKNPWWK